jgi:hypothetical protein
MRVSLPISTVGWASLRLSTRPTAWARRNTKSGVMGRLPTVPRMPSVPKYLRVMIGQARHGLASQDSPVVTQVMNFHEQASKQVRTRSQMTQVAAQGPFQLCVPGLCRINGLLERSQGRGAGGPIERFKASLLALKVFIEGTSRHASQTDDVCNGDGGITLFSQRLCHGGQKPTPVGWRVANGR